MQVNSHATLLSESTSLENPCYLARFLFVKILCLLAVFSWFYRATDLEKVDFQTNVLRLLKTTKLS